ncbi:SMI1/KNR4 family protein [Vibrio parahaemolyticus]|nr:SMI1/KNR4 family protein [Vibrio parahaemolyticus]UYW22224.1 SMI1/KNR4 family protein [Vibrio parahaemolyticus]
MDIMENLALNFRLDAHENAASEDEINDLKNFSSITVPEEYLCIVRKMTEVEILVRGEKYIRIWSPSGCIEMNEAYEIQDCIPNSLAIGDNEEGAALILMQGKKGPGLYLSDFSDLDIDDAKYISASLEDFLTKGVGIEEI